MPSVMVKMLPLMIVIVDDGGSSGRGSGGGRRAGGGGAGEPAQRWRVERQKASCCSWSTEILLSEPSLNNSGWGCASVAGLFKICCVFKGKTICSHFPCTFLFTRVSCPPAIKPRRDFTRP